MPIKKLNNRYLLKTKIEIYRHLIEERIQQLPFPKEPSNLYEPLRYFLNLGGKRSRPILVLLGCDLFGKPVQDAVNVAIAVELFHNFTLIHDDIMDEAPKRRGKATIHSKWNRDIAILSGDVLFSEAYTYLSQCDAKVLPQLIALFSTTAKEICEGQQLDMDFESKENVTIEDYLEMIRLKTSVLLGAALKMGAIIARIADEKTLQNIYDFGINIGIAFQLQDDLLDVYGNPEKFGKQIGGDILANKKTFLLLKVLELCDEKAKFNLKETMRLKKGDKKIDAVKAIFDQYQIREFTKNSKNHFYKKAMYHLEEIKVPHNHKESLLNFTELLFVRES